MALRRTKRLDIYNTVGGFYQGPVQYAAHAILNDGTAILLRNPVQGQGNQNFPTHHPDQQYWANFVHITAQIGGNAANIRRIEIDCSLMPCTVAGGCLFRVPALIRDLYANERLNDVALRIFSARCEIPAANLPAGDKSDHRYFDTRTATGHDVQADYNNHRGWGWVDTGFTNLQYAQDHQAII